MTESNTTLRAALARMTTLSFAEAFSAVVVGDPLGLAARISDALSAAGRWLPAEAVLRRTARALARGLSTLPSIENTTAWLNTLIARAIDESQDSERATEPEEWDAWAEHVERVAARFGVAPAQGADVLVLFHDLTLAERLLLLRGMHLAATRRMREMQDEDWARFQVLFRGIVRTVTRVD